MYNIEQAAAELMLEPADLQEIYSDFFQEATVLLIRCAEKMTTTDFAEMRQALHAVKGMAANLRMVQLVQLTQHAEQLIRKQDSLLLGGILGEIRHEIEVLREAVSCFYHE